MKCAVAILSIMGALMAAPAQAVRPSYSYLEAAYVHSQVDGTDTEADGPRVGLNISLDRALYFTGEYDQQNFQGSNNKVSASAFGFGLHSLNSKFQLFLAGTYERLDFNDDDPLRDAKDEGYGVQLGFRLPYGFIELGGDAKYLQIGPSGDDSDEWRYRATLQSRLSRNVAAVFGYEIFDEANVDQVTGGLRVYFDTGHDRPRRRKPAPPAN